jgi:hypothetical protein
MAGAISQLVNTINEQNNRPRTIVRGPDGRVTGVQ